METGMEAGAGAGAGAGMGVGVRAQAGPEPNAEKRNSKAILIKVGRKMPLLEIVGQGRVVVWDGVIKVNVLLKGKATDWIEEVKKRKGK